MAPQTLRCCGDSSLPEQRSALRSINTLDPPQNTSESLGGYRPSIRCIGAEARGPFPPAAAMVVVVVMLVVFCAKATEKRKKTLKLVV
jgi:hypothetical protein